MAVFGKIESLQKYVPEIATEFSRRIGVMPGIFDGTSPGAIEFGVRAYQFGAQGWKRLSIE